MQAICRNSRYSTIIYVYSICKDYRNDIVSRTLFYRAIVGNIALLVKDAPINSDICQDREMLIQIEI